MIGLGSNRLSVCRRGGMSVTQAGRGGMEWLAGYREPSWAQWWLPYSRQAGEALKAQFPTQWPTIRDYGFAHPEIVGYMNAYAPEDAKIAYSLVEGIGTRWLVSSGLAWIDAGFTASQVTTAKVVAKQLGTSVSGSAYQFLFGAKQGDANRGFAVSEVYTGKWYYDYGNTGTDNLGSHSLNEVYTVTFKAGDFSVNGTKLYSPNAANFTTPYNVAIFNCINNGQPSRQFNGAIAMIEFGGDVNKKYVPFMSRTEGLGMMEIVSGSFRPKQGTGSFSESIESPANQTS